MMQPRYDSEIVLGNVVRRAARLPHPRRRATSPSRSRAVCNPRLPSRRVIRRHVSAPPRDSYDGDNRLVCTAVRMNPAVFASEPSDGCTLGTQGSYGPDRIAKTIYDAAGQGTPAILPPGTSLQENYATSTYTPNGQLASVYDADGPTHLTSYAYDGFDRPVRTTFADATTEQVTAFDAGGNPLTRTDRAGATFTTGYDALNRVLTKALPAAGAIPADTVTTAYGVVNHPLAVDANYGHPLV